MHLGVFIVNYDTGGGTRTLTPSLTPDFESSASAIPPLRHGMTLQYSQKSIFQSILKKNMFFLMGAKAGRLRHTTYRKSPNVRRSG